jgi:hypothetical protein
MFEANSCGQNKKEAFYEKYGKRFLNFILNS